VRGRRRSLVAIAAVALLAASHAAPADARPARRADPATLAVTGWVDLALGEVHKDRTAPPRCARALALLSVAIDRAARSGGGVDAVDGAAATVLADLFPAATAAFEERTRRVGASRKLVGRGRAIGARVLARARSDGSTAVWTGAARVGEPYWVPTPPAFLPPLEALAGTWRTWSIPSGAAFRPGPPPRPGSARFNRDLSEVQQIAGSLTAEQTRIALFWSDGAGTDTPPGHWNRVAVRLIEAGKLPMRRAARVLMKLNTAQADAFVAAWDAKFRYWSLRPVTAMRRYVQADWSPLFATPPFPGYVSGHATTSSAAATVLGHFFPRRAARLGHMAEQAALSRLYAGIHFRADNDAGIELGRRVGAAALENAP
jgi:hypothetical protein